MNFTTCLSVALLTVFSAIGCQESNSQALSEAPQVQAPQVEATETETLAALISVDDLSQLLESDPADVRLLEPGRKLADFESGHLPGTRFLDWVEDMTDTDDRSTYKNPPKEQFAALMSELGIKKDDRIIIYDRLASRLSTRLFWSLKYFGHEKVQVLDGGFGAWNAKHELTKEVAENAASEYQITEVNDNMLAELSLVEKLIGSSECVLVDGRPPAQFSGEAPGKVFHTMEEHPRRGHIPGATNVFWQDNFNQDATFKSVEELKQRYEKAGVNPDQCVVTYCNEGLHAAPPWFVLTQLLDYKDVRLYDSSMAEWAKTKNPMKTTVEE